MGSECHARFVYRKRRKNRTGLEVKFVGLVVKEMNKENITNAARTDSKFFSIVETSRNRSLTRFTGTVTN